MLYGLLAKFGNLRRVKKRLTPESVSKGWDVGESSTWGMDKNFYRSVSAVTVLRHDKTRSQKAFQASLSTARSRKVARFEASRLIAINIGVFFLRSEAFQQTTFIRAEEMAISPKVLPLITLLNLIRCQYLIYFH